MKNVIAIFFCLCAVVNMDNAASLPLATTVPLQPKENTISPVVSPTTTPITSTQKFKTTRALTADICEKYCQQIRPGKYAIKCKTHTKPKQCFRCRDYCRGDGIVIID